MDSLRGAVHSACGDAGSSRRHTVPVVLCYGFSSQSIQVWSVQTLGVLARDAGSGLGSRHFHGHASCATTGLPGSGLL